LQQEDGTWRGEKISGTSSSIDASKVSQTTIYSLDIAALSDDGIPQPGLVGRFGTSIDTIVEMNGVNQTLLAGQSVDCTFNVAGTCGLNVRTFGSLIPDTFW
jgi:hypothetical protein